MEELYSMELKSHPVGTDGLVVQYSTDEQLPAILRRLQWLNKDHQDLGNTTLQHLERYSNVPFAGFDPETMKRYFEEA